MLIECRSLATFEPGDLADVRLAFLDATPIPLRQAWRDSLEPGFAPGVVRTGWREQSFLVFAELSDADIFTRAEHHNDRFWQLGDTFEMFLQPSLGRPYRELHVTPNNLRLQLRFTAPPSGGDGDGADPFSRALIHGDIFKSHTWVNRDTHEWCVLAEIPASVVAGDTAGSAVGPAPAGSDWRFSFGRYDYTHGRNQPIISSSSAHTEPAFHRPHEWGHLRFTF